MPLALKLENAGNRFDKYKSVLIVPCNVCPKMCLAAEQKCPLIDALGGPGKDCFSGYIGNIRKTLSARGINTGVFHVPLRAPMMCLWPMGLRNRLSRESKKFEAIAVIGCESAVATVAGAVDLPGDAIVQMTENRGIANFMMEMHLPFRIELIPSPQGPILLDMDELKK